MMGVCLTYVTRDIREKDMRMFTVASEVIFKEREKYKDPSKHVGKKGKKKNMPRRWEMSAQMSALPSSFSLPAALPGTRLLPGSEAWHMQGSAWKACPAKPSIAT